MQIQISAEDAFGIYKEQLGEMHHELIIAKLQIKKLQEILAQYEQVEADRVRVAAAQRELAQNSTGAKERTGQAAFLPPPLPRPTEVSEGATAG